MVFEHISLRLGIKYLSFGQRDDIILQQSTWTSTVLTKNQTTDFRDGILMSSSGQGCKNIAEQGLTKAMGYEGRPAKNARWCIKG